jgi:hypothetical protein
MFLLDLITLWLSLRKVKLILGEAVLSFSLVTAVKTIKNSQD